MNVRPQRKTRIGRVVSDKMDKTVVVAIETLVRHPLYGRIMRRTKKFKAHDEENLCRIGDRVKIVETRPLSKEKRWRVMQILERPETGRRAEKGERTNDSTSDHA